jgi:hypothetical protein
MGRTEPPWASLTWRDRLKMAAILAFLILGYALFTWGMILLRRELFGEG